MRFFHGTFEYLEEGTILTGRGEEYENDWGKNGFYKYLEMFRPTDMLPQKFSVFMCANPYEVDLAGGHTVFLCEMEVLGDITRHDLNWATEITQMIETGNEDDLEFIKEAALSYWNGLPHHTDEPLWEYKSSMAKVKSIEDFDIAFIDEDIKSEYTEEEFNNYRNSLREQLNENSKKPSVPF